MSNDPLNPLRDRLNALEYCVEILARRICCTMRRRI